MNYSEQLISSARAAHDGSTTGTSTQTALVVLAMQAILTAVVVPAYTCTCSVSGASSTDLQFLLEVLHTSGYGTSISSTTLTITW
jgi:hypothetical protein